jgi:hypothetical protein
VKIVNPIELPMQKAHANVAVIMTRLSSTSNGTSGSGARPWRKKNRIAKIANTANNTRIWVEFQA